ncbi:UTRA domain-containing protein [Maritalea mediterranea]|uniref:UTRA domain-containing protein n=1 Tax=Maritalea mediterranea TaxID=2909667 RepID=A0ABS9E6J4_9HYPH|nr:UTRA domain-containing protein [Maritalea mediterranea]MCF4097053.1 UTRA domain-containing protein [Maritalea mediterranea]
MTERATASPYLTIKNDLLRQIRTGALRPGDAVPHEETIAKQYGVARATVHRAMRELAEEGFVERKRRAGTRVAAVGGRTTKVDISLVRDEIERTGAPYRFKILKREIVQGDPLAQQVLRVPSTQDVLYLEVLHFAGDQPYQLEERWINLDVVPNAATQEFDQTNPNEWLVKNLPYSDAEHQFSAVNANAHQGAALDVPEGEALFVIERRTALDAKMITYVRMLHPGQTYAMAATNFSLSTKN